MCSAVNGKPRGWPKLRNHITKGNVRGTQDAPRETLFLKGLLLRKKEGDPRPDSGMAKELPASW